jgi:toxin CcdB
MAGSIAVPRRKATNISLDSGLLDDLNTRFVVPLMPRALAPLPAARLNPVFAIEGEAYVMVTQFAATVAASDLKGRLMSLQDEAILISNALDMLICGI